jgi:hypothetical protein
MRRFITTSEITPRFPKNPTQLESQAHGVLLACDAVLTKILRA